MSTTATKFNGLTLGQRVSKSGYAGTVIRLCEWSTSMVEVRLAAGVVCVDAADVLPITRQDQAGRWFITMGHAGFNSPANNRQGYDSQAVALATFDRYAARGGR